MVCMLTSLEKEMENYRKQEDKQYDLLETGVYTQDKFEQRNAALRQKIEDCQNRIYQAKATMPKEVNYAERIVALKDAIAGMKNPDYTPEQKNRLLRAIVKRIDFYGQPPVDKSKPFKKNENEYKLTITLRL